MQTLGLTAIAGSTRDGADALAANASEAALKIAPNPPSFIGM